MLFNDTRPNLENATTEIRIELMGEETREA